jgi:hypothetical protein
MGETVMGTPQTLPADFFSKQPAQSAAPQSSNAPQTLPADFFSSQNQPPSTIGPARKTTASDVLNEVSQIPTNPIGVIGDAVDKVTSPIENYTQEGRQEHPILSRVGDVTRAAKDYKRQIVDNPIVQMITAAPGAAEGAEAIAEKLGEGADIAKAKLADGYDLAKAKVADAYAGIRDAFVKPEPPVPTPPTPNPVAAHVAVDTPFDHAVVRKLGGGELKPEAVDLIKQHSGPTIPAGSSPENHLMKAVAPINDAINKQGLALNKVLEDAGNLATSPKADVQAALDAFRKNLPGGTEEQFGKAIDKELARIADSLDSTDPREINAIKRELDQRIKDFRKPEKPVDTSADAAEGARVVIRRALSDKLSQEIPATKPINEELAKNLEARGFLAHKFDKVAYDSVEANAQHLSELKKGKTIVQNQAKDAAAKAAYDAQVAKVSRNLWKVRIGAGAAGIGYFHDQLAKLLELL